MNPREPSDIDEDKLAPADQKRMDSIVRRYGSMENYRAKAKEWGRSGGKKASPIGGFNDREFAKRAGRLGVEAYRAKLKAELKQELLDE